MMKSLPRSKTSLVSTILILSILYVGDFDLFGSDYRVLQSSETATSGKRKLSQGNVIYGHLHMAKTAGTTLNGVMALRFERICGNKGYTLDYLMHNKRNEDIKNNNGGAEKDIYEKNFPRWSRGRVPLSMMDEIGYENCDWVSYEGKWDYWKKRFENWVFPLELHVPCRDPIEHLMSQCNMNSYSFDCNAKNLSEEVTHCDVALKDRFDKRLSEFATLKCFDSSDVKSYMSYMADTLDERKIQGNYTFRATNAKREKEKECIWEKLEIKERVRNILVEQYEYYEFCQSCMHSPHQLKR